jgi:hypothetical protein
VDEHFTKEALPLHYNNVVIYLYRDPIEAMRSVQRRFTFSDHLRNIECPKTDLSIKDVEESKKDLFGLDEFDRNYTAYNRTRKYRIYCVKYDMFFENIQFFNRTLNLIDYPKLYPLKKETQTKNNESSSAALEEVYRLLRTNMAQRPFIFTS